MFVIYFEMHRKYDKLVNTKMKANMLRIKNVEDKI